MYFMVSQAIYSFLSTLGFAVLFNAPKNCLIKASSCGMLGWLVNILTLNFLGETASTFMGAMTVAFLGEFYAKIFRKPATVFIIPGVIPLVPGAGMYYTMLSLITGNFSETADIGSETVFTAFSIAIAIIVASAVSKTIIRYTSSRNNKR